VTDDSSIDPTGSAVPNDRGVYGITVAAELSGVAVQSLRLYEQRGLLMPSRTEGGTRRYSAADLHRLRRITELLSDGVNLAGVAKILELEDDNSKLASDITQLVDDNKRLDTDNVRMRTDPADARDDAPS